MHWTLDHRAGTPPTATWAIVEGTNDYPVCGDRIEFSGDEAECNTANRLWGKSNWYYTVVATMESCSPATVDPEIIFRAGGTKIIVGLLALIALAIFVGIYSIRRLKRA